ncbi:MAG: response regulator [Parasphingorhabdus sp.]|nr:response regulator [Parasphingorhabdus sp.]
MSLANNIRGHLPYLRRYARALTGSQNSGDNFVKATLEAIIASPDQFDDKPTPRIALYRIFNSIWSSADVETSIGNEGYIDGDHAAGGRLDRMSPLSRQVLLLSSLEDFESAEVANIVGISVNEIDSHLTAALADIDAETRTSVLIIEDEPLISMELEHIVRGLGHDISGTATTRRDAVASADRNRPGLVLADIQLADGSSGIDAVRDLLDKFDVPVIFVTAYPERLLTGENIEPTFLVTKPFQPNAIRAAISQALFFNERAEAA